jgi:lysyl endopeptidase
VLCTGTLMNNTRLDNRALILTANHCGIRDTNTNTVTAYFNTETESCVGTEDGRADQNIVGRTFLARDDNSDFTLFELASTPPTTFNVFYAGWDARSGVAPQSGVTIHHPSGDEKKISVYSTAAMAVEDVRIGAPAPGDGFNVDAWKVTWARGTTEQGSSGSGLFSQNKQVVGVLSGGGASCDTPTEPDFFGRLERAWQANSATTGQLKTHLDPTSTGCLQLDGKDPGDAGTLCSGTITPGTGGSGSNADDGGGGNLGLGVGVLALVAARRRRQWVR